MSLLTTVQAAAKLGVSPSTLNKMRLSGNGAPFIKIGVAVRYRAEDLDAWVAGQLRRSTSDTGPAATGTTAQGAA